MAWRGLALSTAGVLIDFLGVRYVVARFCNPAYMYQLASQAIRVRQCHLRQRLLEVHGPQLAKSIVVQTRWPVVAEEYIEYGDVLATAQAYADEVPPCGHRTHKHT